MPVWLPQLLYFAPRGPGPRPDPDDSDSDAGDEAYLAYSDDEVLAFGDDEPVEYTFG